MVTVLSPYGTQSFLSRSRVFDPGTRRHAFGLWVSLRHPIFTTGSMPFWLADDETTALSVLFSFQYLLRFFPRDAFLRFTALSSTGRVPEASGCQPMPLRVGTPEWACSFFYRRV